MTGGKSANTIMHIANKYCTQNRAHVLKKMFWVSLGPMDTGSESLDQMLLNGLSFPEVLVYVFWGLELKKE